MSIVCRHVREKWDTLGDQRQAIHGDVMLWLTTTDPSTPQWAIAPWRNLNKWMDEQP